MIVTRVSEDRWREAQAFEPNFARQSLKARDDWNKWWYVQFDGYRHL